MFYSNYILILLIVDIVLSFFFGFIVLIIDQGWKKIINVRFFAFAVSVVIWQITNLMMFINIHTQNDLLWTRLTYLTGVFGAYFLLKFIMVFPKINVQNKLLVKITDLFGLLVTLFAAIITIMPNTITAVTYLSGSRSPQYGSLFPLFAFALIILVLLILIFALINYLRSDKLEKIKMKYMIIGIVIMLVLIIFTDIISPLFMGNNYLSNFDAFSLIFLFGFTFYAIIKHHLFNIKVILTETAVGLVVLVSLIQTLIANSSTQRIISGGVFILVVYGGYLIIRSVLDEIKQKEKLQELTTQLAQANSHLQELDKMKTEFVSLASHELLTPVSAIEGYLSMLLDEKLAKVEDPTAVKFLDNVYKSAKRLARLVTDLLNISRIEEGRLLVEKQDVNLSDIIQQTVDELKFKAEEGHQRIEFAGQDTSDKIQDTNKTPIMTFGDADKIKEIVVNLVGNSIKYSKEPGTITIDIKKVPTAVIQSTWDKIEAEIKARPLDDQEAIKSAVDEHLRGLVGDEQILVSVKDQGIGIPREELPRLFKKFHRVGDFSTAESQGTGLGLYISRALTELNHGRIWADSEGQGKGSTFAFSLPLLEHKKEIQDLEAQAPKTGEQLKPLARPAKAAEEL